MWLLCPRGLRALSGNILLTAYLIVGGSSYLMFGVRQTQTLRMIIEQIIDSSSQYDQACIGTLSGYPTYLDTIRVTPSHFRLSSKAQSDTYFLSSRPTTP